MSRQLLRRQVNRSETTVGLWAKPKAKRIHYAKRGVRQYSTRTDSESWDNRMRDHRILTSANEGGLWEEI